MSSEREEQAIRERAYFIWVREGRPKGRDIANWLEAEAEINQSCNDVGGFVRSWADALAAGHRIQDCSPALAGTDSKIMEVRRHSGRPAERRNRAPPSAEERRSQKKRSNDQ
jgi:hypothetical protein